MNIVNKYIFLSRSKKNIGNKPLIETAKLEIPNINSSDMIIPSLLTDNFDFINCRWSVIYPL